MNDEETAMLGRVARVLKMFRSSTAFLLVPMACICSCSNQSSPPINADQASAEPCPLALPAPHILPGSRPEHRDPGHWISSFENPDELLLTTEQIDELNAAALRISPNPAGLGARYSVLSGALDPALVVDQMRSGIERHREQASNGHRVTLSGETPSPSFFTDLDQIQRSYRGSTAYRIVNALTELRCHPTTQGLYEHAGDVDFDLLLCSTLRPGEVVRVVSGHPQGWLIVRSSYVAGWVQEDALGPQLADENAERILDADPFIVVVADRSPVWATEERRHQLASVRVGLRLPLLEEERAGLVRVLSPSSDGLSEGYVDADAVHVGYLPMTRRHVVAHAFRQLDDTFGWAGAGGDRDCSRFLMDLFSLFGLHLPRNSFFQSRTGSYTIDTAEMSDIERRRTFDHALSQGIPLLFMPGHIMLLLGRDGDDYIAIHQFSGYRVGCRPDEDTKMSVDRVSVTTLRLGEGSRRRSFMERITRVAVFGGQGTSL